MDQSTCQANPTLEHSGFETISHLLCADELARLRTECDRLILNSPGAGIRSLLSRSDAIAEWAGSQVVRQLIESRIGREAFVARSILFDKHAAANWDVTWHQDTTIAVERRIETPEFGPWSVKDGIQHVRPPAEILDRMPTIRLHLDDTPSENGALLVIPGSHRFGILPHDRIQEFTNTATPIFCELKAGDVMLMRPLLLHASRKSVHPSRRRVIHLEFASGRLPGSLTWAIC